jgi:hypothetical protein
MIQELELVVLTRDLPEEGLQVGDIGTVVLLHQGGAGCEVEFAYPFTGVSSSDSKMMLLFQQREVW